MHAALRSFVCLRLHLLSKCSSHASQLVCNLCEVRPLQWLSRPALLHQRSPLGIAGLGHSRPQRVTQDSTLHRNKLSFTWMKIDNGALVDDNNVLGLSPAFITLFAYVQKKTKKVWQRRCVLIAHRWWCRSAGLRMVLLRLASPTLPHQMRTHQPAKCS